MKIEDKKFQLLPCPFCGGQPFLGTTTYEDKHMYYPQCQTPDCIMEESASTWPTAAAAIAAWNARAGGKYDLSHLDRFIYLARELYPMAIGWSVAYQREHGLEEPHPKHSEIIDEFTGVMDALCTQPLPAPPTEASK